MKIIKTINAFTLVELLLAMALTVLLGGILYLIQTQGLGTVARGTAKLTLQSDIRKIVEKIVTDLQNALEVLEISENSIKVSRYKDMLLDNDSDITSHYPIEIVKYSTEVNKKQATIYREVDKSMPQHVLKIDDIEEPIFIPYYAVIDPNYGIEFRKFDVKINDSDQRKRICFIRIKFKAKLGKESFTLITGVTLKPAFARLLQPNWYFR